MDEKWFVPHDRPRAEHRVTETERRGLPDVHAVRFRGQDAAQRVQQVVLALCGQGRLELAVRVEVILDRAFRAARDEHQRPGSSRQGFLGRILDQRLVDNRQHFLGARLGGGQKASAPPSHRENGRTYRSGTWHGCLGRSATENAMIPEPTAMTGERRGTARVQQR